MTRFRFVLLASMASALAACGGGSSDESPPNPYRSASASIGPAGGTVTLSGGPSVVIPPGALTSAIAITIVETGVKSPIGAPVYAFKPSGTTFDAAHVVTVVFPLPTVLGSEASIYWAPTGQTVYDPLPAVVDPGSSPTTATASARIYHFSWGHAGAPCVVDDACTPASAECKVGVQACSSGAPVCIQQAANVSDGTSCSLGLCVAGACVGACNPVDLAAAPVVDVLYAGSTVPAATGGTIANGTYYETAFNVYADVDPALAGTAQAAWVVSGGSSVQGAEWFPGSTSMDRFNATLAPSGTALTLDLTCPSVGTVTYQGYTATGTELRLYYPGEAGQTLELVLFKQP